MNNKPLSSQQLGKEMDLFYQDRLVGSGLPLLTPKGATIKRELESFVLEEEGKRGYLHTATPEIAKKELYEVSGHWQHYKDDMFQIEMNDGTYALRPMTCPFHFLLYNRKPRREQDLPLRYAEIANLFRNENTGSLGGLTRLRQFTLADSHIFCREEQFEDEFRGVLDLIDHTSSKLGISDYWYRFSKWDPSNPKGKYVDNPKAWEETQTSMKSLLDKMGLDYVEADGEAAFYGPKLDLQYKNIHGKEDTLITIQTDFALPEKFGSTYMNDEGEKVQPTVIHRSSIGCLERTMAYVLEKTQGKLPLWLNPNQVKVLTLGGETAYAGNLQERLRNEGIRAEMDSREASIGKKAKKARLERFNYTVTVGEKEIESNTLAIKKRDTNEIIIMNPDEFVEKIKSEIQEKE